jgi:hypothetical protein
LRNLVLQLPTETWGKEKLSISQLNKLLPPIVKAYREVGFSTYEKDHSLLAQLVREKNDQASDIARTGEVSELMIPPMPSAIHDQSFANASATFTARADWMEARITAVEDDLVVRRIALEQKHVQYATEEKARYDCVVERFQQEYEALLNRQFEKHEKLMAVENARRRGEAASKFNEEVLIELLWVQIKKDRKNADRYSEVGGGGGGGAARVRPGEHSCPITTEVMEDPVLAMDGNTYERSAIEQWLVTNDTSPLTNEAVPSKMVVPNLALRKIIQDWVA